MLSYTFRFTVIWSTRSNINVEKLRSTLAKASGVYQLFSSVLLQVCRKYEFTKAFQVKYISRTLCVNDSALNLKMPNLLPTFFCLRIEKEYALR